VALVERSIVSVVTRGLIRLLVARPKYFVHVLELLVTEFVEVLSAVHQVTE